MGAQNCKRFGSSRVKHTCRFAVHFSLILSDITGERYMHVFLRVKNHHFCEIALSNLAQMFMDQGTHLFVD